MASVSYREAGVDLEAGTRAVELMKDAVRATYGPEVLLGIGAFGGLFDVSALKGMDSRCWWPPPMAWAPRPRSPRRWIALTRSALTSSTTASTTSWCRARGRCSSWTTSPAAKSTPKWLRASSRAVQRPAWPPAVRFWAARRPRCPVSTRRASSTWWVRSWAWWIAHKSSTAAASCLGIESSAWHPPGCTPTASRWRGVCSMAMICTRRRPELGRPLGEALLAPHRCYLPQVQRLQQAGVTIKGLAHITGGGLIDNPPRILPDGVAFHLHRGSLAHSPALPAHPTRRPHRRSRDGPRLQSRPGHAGRGASRSGQPSVRPAGRCLAGGRSSGRGAGLRDLVIGLQVAGGRWQVKENLLSKLPPATCNLPLATRKKRPS